MDKYKSILEQVRGKNDKKAKEKEAAAIAEVMCLSVDESPHMIALEDGAAILAALYTLCLDDVTHVEHISSSGIGWCI